MDATSRCGSAEGRCQRSDGNTFGTLTLAATVRLMTPLVLTAMGGVFADRANIFNIGLESFMLIERVLCHVRQLFDGKSRRGPCSQS